MSLGTATIPVFIPAVNRFDLLRRAVWSIPRRLTSEPVIINNSGGELPDDFHEYTIITPDKPLTFSQTQNLMLRMAQRHPFYFFMHSDAEDNEGILDKLTEFAMLQREKWGVIFTSYDALACFNTESMNAIGGWDEGFSWYAGDQDCYHRLRLSGYATLDSGLQVKHTPSQTLQSDPLIAAQVQSEFKNRCQRYLEKWGGSAGQEKYEVAWNGKTPAQ